MAEFNAYVRARRTDNYVKLGEVYPVTCLVDGMVTFLADGVPVTCNIEDEDFEVVLNDSVCAECNSCCGDEPAVSVADMRLFVDSVGKCLMVAGNMEYQFSINYCPVCGRKFVQD